MLVTGDGSWRADRLPPISSFAPQAVLGQRQQMGFAGSQLCTSSEAMQQHQDLPTGAGPVSYLQSYVVPSGSCLYSLR